MSDQDGWHSRGDFSSSQKDLASRYVSACASNDLPAVRTLLEDCGVPVDSGECSPLIATNGQMLSRFIFAVYEEAKFQN